MVEIEIFPLEKREKVLARSLARASPRARAYLPSHLALRGVAVEAYPALIVCALARARRASVSPRSSVVASLARGARDASPREIASSWITTATARAATRRDDARVTTASPPRSSVARAPSTELADARDRVVDIARASSIQASSPSASVASARDSGGHVAGTPTRRDGGEMIAVSYRTLRHVG